MSWFHRLASPATPAAAPAGLDHLRRLILLRWWTIAAQLGAIAFAHWVVQAYLRLPPMLTTVAMLLAFNIITLLHLPRRKLVSHRELFAQLLVDLSALTVLLYFSGGAANPLASLYLLPIAFGAVILPATLAAVLTLLGVGAYSLLLFYRVPLTVADYVHANALHLFGMWFTYTLSALVIAWILVQATANARRRDHELATAREAALRNERVVALGSLAAGTAHELGTPLGTLAILIDELLDDPSTTAAQRELLLTMKNEVVRCKRTMTNLSARAGATRAEGGRVLALDRWIEICIAEWKSSAHAVPVKLEIESRGSAPLVLTEATIEQSWRNLLDNAAQASRQTLRCQCSWDAKEFIMVITDQGPGFPAEVLAGAGRGLLRTGHSGSGMGLLLAFTSIERLGGSIVLANPPGGGASVTLSLPLERLLADGSPPNAQEPPAPVLEDCPKPSRILA